MTPTAATAREALRHHHEELAGKMAGYVDALTGGAPVADPEPFVRFLREELLPHAAGEDRYLYPAVEPLLKAHGMATATMRVDHRAIEGYVGALEQAAARLRGAEGAERAKATEDVTRLAWQLHALFNVHLQKEEQVYMPLFAQYVAETEQQRILRQMHEVPAAGPAPDGTDDPAAGSNFMVAGEFGGSRPPGGAADLDVRTMAPARRHAMIFATFEALAPGQAFILVNDHDPRPLHYQFQAEQAGKFTWTYLEQGPEVWRVRIGRP